jgi:hypothetical protein
MTIIWYIVITVASMVVAEIIRPKQKYDPPPAAGLEDFTVPTAEEGRPIPVLYGTVKLEGPNVVWWDEPNAVDNKESYKSGLWGTDWAHKGYFYYFSMHVVLCAGPLDGIEAILFEDHIAWVGDAMDEEIFVDNEGLFGGEDGGGGVKGFIDVMSGAGTQQPNEWLMAQMPATDQATESLITEGMHVDYVETYNRLYEEGYIALYTQMIEDDQISGGLENLAIGKQLLQELVDRLLAGYRAWLAQQGYDDTIPFLVNSPDLIPAFRGVTSLVFKAFYFGTTTFLRPLKVGCRRHVSGLGQGAFSKVGTTKRDCNPIEILYDLMHNSDYGMGIPGYRFDKESYFYASRILYEENFGMSYKISSHTDFETLINDILRHIEAIQFISPLTGLETIKLIRYDYTLFRMPSFDESNILELISYTRGTWEETINEVKVNYIDRDNFFTPGTVIVQDNSNWHMQNRAVFSSTRVYNGIYERELATRVAIRDLRNLSVPLAHVQFTVNRTAYGIMPGDVIEFSWADVGVISMSIRVQQVNYGTSTDLAMTIHGIQEVSDIGNTEFVIPKGSSWLDQNVNGAVIGVGADALSVPPDYSVVNEAPYFLTHVDAEMPDDSTDGKYWPAASSPTAAFYDVYTRIPPVETWERVERQRPINHHFKVEYPVTQYADTIHIRGVMPVTTVAQDESQIWRNMAQIGGELIAFTQFFDNRDGTYLLEGVIYRGVADTVPLPHIIGSDVWIFGGDVPRTDRPFAEGDTVELGLTLARADGTAFDSVLQTNEITFKARHFRPYPPASFMVGGVEFPLTYIDEDPIQLTWSHRTRFQNLTLVDNSTPTDYGPEAGTTYTLRIYGDDGTLIRTETGLTGKSYSYSHAQELIDSGIFNPKLHFQLESVRDGYTSWQYQIRTVYRTIGGTIGGYGSIYGEQYGSAIEGTTENPGTVPGVIDDPVQNPAPLPDPTAPPSPGSLPGDNGEPDAVPGTGSGWELVGDEYAPSRMPAQILNPRPAVEIGFDSRYLWTHGQVPYEVPVSVMGGAPPFYFTISGSAGASISRMAPAFNPQSFSWAKVTLPAGATGLITVRVYDQEHRTTPVTTVTWEVKLKDAKFLFIDSVNGSGSGYGTISAPLRDISDWYKGSRGDNTYAGRICVYRTGTYVPDNDPADATWNNVMHLSSKKPLSHIGFPGESVTWDFGQGPAYQGISDNPGGNIEDLFFANLRLYRGQCHARFWYYSERHVWWDLLLEASQLDQWSEDNIGGVIYLRAKHTDISVMDVEVKDFPVRSSDTENTAGFEFYHIVRAAVDGVVGNNFRASTLVYVKSKAYRMTVTNCSQWTDGEPSRGAFYSTANWYGDPMSGYTDVDGDNSLLQLRYCRGFQSNDDGDGFLLASQLSYKIRGKRYADRLTSVAGGYDIGTTNTGFIAGSLFANDRSPIIEGNYTVDAETREYTRADFATNTDPSGSLTDADRYKVGYLVNASAATPDPDPDPDPPGPVGTLESTDLAKILWSAQNDGGVSWDDALDGRSFTDYTSAQNSSNSEFFLIQEEEVPVPTPTPGVGDIFFDELIYANGSSIVNVVPPTSVNGAKWTWSNTDANSLIEVQDDKLELTYAAGESWVEQRFTLGTRVNQTVTMEWDLGIPSNYEHFAGSGGDAAGSNQKLFHLWEEVYTDVPKVGASMWWQSGNTSSVSIDMKTVSVGMGPKGNSHADFITFADRGTTFAMKVVVVPPTSSSNGSVTMYKNGAEICYASVDNWDTGFAGYMVGYMMGWHNAAYAVDTAFTIDNLRFTL